MNWNPWKRKPEPEWPRGFTLEIIERVDGLGRAEDVVVIVPRPGWWARRIPVKGVMGYKVCKLKWPERAKKEGDDDARTCEA